MAVDVALAPLAPIVIGTNVPPPLDDLNTPDAVWAKTAPSSLKSVDRYRLGDPAMGPAPFSSAVPLHVRSTVQCCTAGRPDLGSVPPSRAGALAPPFGNAGE